MDCRSFTEVTKISSQGIFSRYPIYNSLDSFKYIICVDILYIKARPINTIEIFSLHF